MEFNPSKCQVVRVATARKAINTVYTLHGQILEVVISTWGLTSPVAYLGTPTLTELLEMQIELWDTFGEISNQKKQKMGETAYNTLVRPQLEYAAPIWDPYTKDKTLQRKKNQRRAARWTTSNYDYRSSVTSMLDQLSWRTLEQRRADARLCLFYKMVHGIVTVPLPDYVHPTHRVSRYCHLMTFRQIHTNRNYYKYPFSPLAIVQWNALPESVVSLQDLEAFEVAVSKLQHSKP